MIMFFFLLVLGVGEESGLNDLDENKTDELISFDSDHIVLSNSSSSNNLQSQTMPVNNRRRKKHQIHEIVLINFRHCFKKILLIHSIFLQTPYQIMREQVCFRCFTKK